MSYKAIARKYRPETFTEVVGQEHVTATLRAAMRRGKLSHAYLFSGPRGCGKTTVARLLAKALNCSDMQDGDPCGKCATCEGIARGTFLDVLEIDAASNTGVDNVRELRDMAKLAPGEGNSRVFIIDEVHMLSKGAFNALLKILEEPPPRVFFFFATTEPNKIPRTILSRCQRFDFRLLSRDQLTARMQEICDAEGATVDDSGLRILASLAEGSMRDGLSLLDQAIASCEGTIDEAALSALFGLVRSELYLELGDAMLARDPARGLALVDKLAAAGQDLVIFARGLLTHFRNLLVLKVDSKLCDAVDLTPEQVAQLDPFLAHFDEGDLLAMLDRTGQHYDRIHRSTQPRILLEATVVELCRWERRVVLDDLVQRLRRLLAGGGVPGGGGGPKQATARGGAGGRPQVAPTPERAAPAAAASAPPAPSPAPSPAPAGAHAAADTVNGWTDFVNAVMGQNPGLASCLMTGLPDLNRDEGRLTVAFEPGNDFMLKRLEEGRTDLERHVSSFFGDSLQVVLELVGSGSGPSQEQQEAVRREVAPTDRETLALECKDDTALDQLVDLVRGEPVADAERERWQQGDQTEKTDKDPDAGTT